MKSSLVLVLVASSLVVACGDDSDPTGGGGAAEGGQAEGGSGGGAASPEIASANAPDETTILVHLTAEPPDAPLDASAYVVSSEQGELGVESVEYDAATKTLTLTTAQQKLGVEYEVRVAAPESALDGAAETFMSADTATLWTFDFADSSTYEVQAERIAVGEHVVFYATAHGLGSDTDEALQYFDEEIFPIETALLHEAPDRDENGKIVILGLDGGGYYGGYFSPVNTLSEELAVQYGFHSNEMEILYVSVPDVYGEWGAVNIIAHEFSHLLYNENHDFSEEDWSWHNEGLAECAVHAVAGENELSAYYYFFLPELADGLSLVNWEFASYPQYAQAYMFWTYAASRLGGVDAYGELFDLTGNPQDVSAFLQGELEQSVAQVQLDMLTALWIQAPTGPYGYEGMIPYAALPQLATSAPQALQTFEGVFFGGNGNGLIGVGTGPEVLLRAINAEGAVDDVAPFDAAGGVMIALHAAELPSSEVQSSGTFAIGAAAPRASAAEDRAWLHPPPVKPANMRLIEKWRRSAHGF